MHYLTNLWNALDFDTLRDAAAAVGISSPQYFSKLFKRAYGMTPGEYRVRGKLGGHGV